MQMVQLRMFVLIRNRNQSVLILQRYLVQRPRFHRELQLAVIRQQWLLAVSFVPANEEKSVYD